VLRISTVCPEAVEAPYSRSSFAQIRANLASFLALFQGGEGSGFDDLIDHEGYPEVSQRFADHVQAAIDAIDDVETPLHEQVVAMDNDRGETDCANVHANPDTPAEPSACRVAGLIRRITNDLKIDFVTLVGVSIPGSAQTDND